MGADDLLAVHDYSSGHRYFAAKDQLGSVRALTRRDGVWTAALRYKSYGEVLSSAGTIPFRLRYRWIGREFDEETGFYYLRARYYDPASQRFTQEDPIGYAGGSNVYAYGDGNPTNGRDLNGLWKSVLPFSWQMPPAVFTAYSGCFYSNCSDPGDRRTWLTDVEAHWAEIELEDMLQNGYIAYREAAWGVVKKNRLMGHARPLSETEYERLVRAVNRYVKPSPDWALGFLERSVFLVNLGSMAPSTKGWTNADLGFVLLNPNVFTGQQQLTPRLIANVVVHEILHLVRYDRVLASVLGLGDCAAHRLLYRVADAITGPWGQGAAPGSNHVC